MSNELVDQGAQGLDVGKNALQDVGGYASLSMIKRRFDDQNLRGFTTRCKHLVKPQKKKSASVKMMEGGKYGGGKKEQLMTQSIAAHLSNIVVLLF